MVHLAIIKMSIVSHLVMLTIEKAEAKTFSFKISKSNKFRVWRKADTNL